MTVRFLAAIEESLIPTANRVRIQLTSNADFQPAACRVSNWAGTLPVEVVTDGSAFAFLVDATWCGTQGALILQGSTNLCPLTGGATVNVAAGGVDPCSPNPTTVTVTVTPPPAQYLVRGQAVTAPAATATQSPNLNYPVVWSVEPPLPEGLFIDPHTGVIQGTSLFAAPSATYVVKASTKGGTGTANLTLQVQNTPNTVTVATVPAQTWTHAVAITPVQASATDTDPTVTTFTWSITPALPSGVSLNTATGQITGTPAAAAAQTAYTLTATDRTGATGSTTFNITVS